MSTSEEADFWIRVPPPIWGLLSVAIAFGVDTIFDWTALAVIKSQPLALVLFIGGLVSMTWGRLTFAKAGTEIMPASKENAKLVTNGPFNYSRNPMYLGLMLVSIGIAFSFGTIPYFMASVLLFWLIRVRFIPFEEAKMERQYGQAFRDYKTAVRRWI